jgi:hypothetical protein
MNTWVWTPIRELFFTLVGEGHSDRIVEEWMKDLASLSHMDWRSNCGKPGMQVESMGPRWGCNVSVGSPNTCWRIPDFFNGPRHFNTRDLLPPTSFFSFFLNAEYIFIQLSLRGDYKLATLKATFNVLRKFVFWNMFLTSSSSAIFSEYFSSTEEMERLQGPPEMARFRIKISKLRNGHFSARTSVCVCVCFWINRVKMINTYKNYSYNKNYLNEI